MRFPVTRPSSSSRGAAAAVAAVGLLVASCGGAATRGADGAPPGPTGDQDDGGATRGLDVEAGGGTGTAKASPAALAAQKRYAHRIALTIGVDAYQAPIPALRFAVSDARRTAELFRQMGFDRVETIENDGATRAGMLDALQHKLPAMVGKNDLVVVFFAGHGVSRGDMGYVLPKDATKDIEKTGVSVQELKDLALRLDSPHVLYLVDACFSGTIFKHDAATGATQGYWDAVSAGRVVQVMSGGRADETVQEVDGWGTFTRALHDGLGGAADADKDQVVTVAELGAYVEHRIPKETKDKQHPEWGWLDGTGMITLVDARKVAAPAETIPRVVVSGLEGDMDRVYAAVDRKELKEAEGLVRDLLLKRDDAGLHLVLAAIYLERDATGNASLIEAELKSADAAKPTADLQKILLDLKSRLERARRQAY